MSQRRPRSSLFAAPQQPGATRGEASMTQIEEFEDYRRRHSKQNRDIIIENASRKTTIKTLQDEVAALQLELLEVRQANIHLQAQMRKMRKDDDRLRDESTRAALDQIISVLPALKQLRSILSVPTPTSNISQPPPMRASKESLMRYMGVTNATRPAASWGSTLGLGTVAEGSEGSDSAWMEDPRRVARRKSRGRLSATGPTAAPRSPGPSNFDIRTLHPPPPPLPSASPRPSPRKGQPSPAKASPGKAFASPGRDRRHKRRRESGLVVPPPRAPSPEDSSHWEEGGAVQISLEEAKEVFGGGAIAAPVALEVGKVKVKDIKQGLAAAGSEDVGPRGRTVSGGRRESRVGSKAGEAPVPNSAIMTDTRPALPAFETPATSDEAVEDDGIRGRRSRKSVCYKEPSLTKKMRKPDGLSVEEALRPARQSLSAASSTTTTPALSPSSSSTVTASRSLVPLAATTSHLTGMRRKSVLPKSSSSRLQAVEQAPQEADEQDEDDLDDSPDLMLDTPVPVLVTPASTDGGPTSRANGAVSSGSTDREGTTPTPLPRPAAEVVTRQPVPAMRIGTTSASSTGSRPPSSTKPLGPSRKSPRKSASASTAAAPSSSSKLGIGIGRPPPSASRPASKPRDALASLPGDNVPVVAGGAHAKSIGAGAGGKETSKQNGSHSLDEAGRKAVLGRRTSSVKGRYVDV